MTEFNMQAPETIATDSPEVRCDGGALGHPRVYLRIGDAGWVECPYCDCRFELNTDPKPAESR
ncbi:MAG: zinc-finger domain-containing protein [Proteobacteria bacterium]|nr:zinc-finger domain-containing protein [Pseudomonadota bacterium]